MLLTYLVPSEVRRKLLRALWKERMSGSASELSRFAGVSFAAAHAELQEMERVGLAVGHSVGRSLVYGANFNHPMAEALRNLVEDDGTEFKFSPSISDEDVLSNLERFGAPLGGQGGMVPKTRLSLEESLAKSMKVARHKATVARVLPVVLVRNKDSLNFGRLKVFAQRERELRTLGFFLELTGKLSGDRDFERWAESLMDRRVKKETDFFVVPGGKYSQKLTNRNTPALAKKWHFRMNMTMENFESLFEKFEGSSE